jgi:hypothetical protein
MFAKLCQAKLNEFEIEAWLDEKGLSSGDNWKDIIDENIKSSDVLILILSENSNKSTYVNYEWAFALGIGKQIIPLLISPTTKHPKLETIEHIDFTHNEDWEKLARDIKKLANQQKQQIQWDKTIEIDKSIKIYKLRQQIDGKLKLSWETFGKGIEILNKYSDYLGFRPDIICGINEAGIMIASYLCFKRGKGNKKFGYFFLGGSSNTMRNIDKFHLPKWNKNCQPDVLLVDSEIKSGITGKTVIEKIKEEYNSPKIKYICLAGVVNVDKINEIKSLLDFGWKLNKKIEKNNQYKADLLAYYISTPGFEPPGDIR